MEPADGTRPTEGRWRLAGSAIPGLPEGPLELRVDDGRITALAPLDGEVTDGALTLLPLLSNSHDHGRGCGTVLTGHLDEPLERWLGGLTPSGDPDAQYAWVTAASRRMLASGVGAAVCCINLHTTDVDREMAEACRAVRDVGIRSAVVYPITDETGPDVFDRVEALAAAHACSLIDLQLGPVNPQWVPEPMLAATAEHAARTGRGIHMHLLETPGQRIWADTEHPEGIVTWLDGLALLGPGTTLAHGTQLREYEFELLAERGCCVALNASSNLRLASGIPPVDTALRRLGRSAMGLDGLTLGDDADGWSELRLLRGLAQAQRGDKVPADEVLALAADPTRSGLGPACADPVQVGAVADFVLADLGPWAHLHGRPGWTPAEIAVCAMTAAQVREVWVGGCRVMG